MQLRGMDDKVFIYMHELQGRRKRVHSMVMLVKCGTNDAKSSVYISAQHSEVQVCCYKVNCGAREVREV